MNYVTDRDLGDETDVAPDGLPWGGTPITGECEWCSGPLPEDWESIWCSEGCRMASRADRMGDLG